MLKEITCIMCPNGCELEILIDEFNNILNIDGAICKRGISYAKDELTNPLRNISTSIKVNNGDRILTSVRLTNPIPKDSIFNAIKEIKKCSVDAPVKINTVVIHNLLGYDTDVIVTSNVNLKK